MALIKIIIISLLIIVFGWRCSDGCLTHEKIALLQLRRSFNESTVLSDWVKESSDCCEWVGIECDESTKAIKSLNLSSVIDDNYIQTKMRSGILLYLNATLFQPFEKLQFLSLEGNGLDGFVHDGGLEKLSKLKKLEFLNLDDNHFNSSIFPSLNSLLSLKTLYLSSNDIKGVERQLTLPNLKFLDLSYNTLGKDIITLLNGLTSLKYLNLRQNQLNGSVNFKDVPSSLEELDISGNFIKEMVIPKDGESLCNLKVIWLEDVDADKISLLQSLASLPFLKTVHLGQNYFSQHMTTLKLHNMTNVEELMMDASDLDINFFRRLDGLHSLKVLYLNNSVINEPLTAQDLPNFKKLEVLDMSNIVGLDASFLHSVGEMNALKVFKLTSCGHNESRIIALQGLCKLSHVQTLDLSNNNLVGNLPACMANLTSLQRLALSGNQFTGNLIESPIASLTSIQELYLSDNDFQIPSSFGPLYNHSKLNTFIGDGNEIYGDVVPRSWVPKFQLNTLYLSCHGNVGAIPDFLFHQHDLQFVEISHIHFKGEFPYWLLDNNTGMTTLTLVNNSLSGHVFSPSHSLISLEELDISNNLLNGEIPMNFGTFFPNLMKLNMSSNQFQGNIPPSLGDISSLSSLDLSNNQLIGTIPKQLGKGCKNLEELILTNNKLHGQIFPVDFNLTVLRNLQLGGNSFTSLSDSLSRSDLGTLDISNNRLSGSIPKWMAKISSLQEIRMSNNNLEGSIPVEFCQLDELGALDLSGNNISGTIPPCFDNEHIYEVRLSQNKLQGTLRDFFYNISSNIVILDLCNNSLTGFIPHSISRLSMLSFLFLNDNNLEGEVPTQMCKLDKLCLINLSHNNLSGRIPSCLRTTSSFEESHGMPYDETGLNWNHSLPNEDIQFITKKTSYNFHGKVLYYMSGIDLSSNKFVGEIPLEFGNLSSVLVLNLSRNCLTGKIPPTFADLKQIESLDLSHNFLSGEIPPRLVDLYSLSVFIVANNNLSGAIPRTAQFATFEESSYKGNPLLCGEPLLRSCDNTGEIPSTTIHDGEEDDDSFMDMDSFIASCVASFVVVIASLAIVLLINPYWRRWWFYHTEEWMTSCYYFVVDNLFWFPLKYFNVATIFH
ncbi:hypothetical protein ACFE04_000277 [Oxalis oulophora]